MCVCACACMRVHVRVWGDTPHAPRCPWHPPSTCPLPRAAGSPKQQNSISPELIEIIRFCLKIFYLWTFLNSYRLELITPNIPHPPAPPPRAEKTQIRRITITLEPIEIIQFCLKICDPWTLLHTYRLGLMCRWGGVLSQMALLCFGPKKVHLFRSCEPLIKNFPVFALDPIRPYLDWALRGFLTS